MSRHRLTLIVVLLIALGVRCAYLPVNPYPYDQSILHGELARNIIDHGRWFYVNNRAVELVEARRSEEHRQIDPASVSFKSVDAHPQWQRQISEVVGPGVVLAGVWSLTASERYLYGAILQIAIDTLVVLLVYRIAMLLFKRRRTALIAAVLYAVFPPIARRASIVAPDIWGIDFTIAIAAAYLEAMRSARRWRWGVICGVLTGVGAYFRPNVLIIPAALALADLRWVGWRRPLRVAATATVAAAVLLTPWTIANYAAFHRFIPTRTGFGQNLWEALGEVHNDFGAEYDDLATLRLVHRTHPELVFGTPAYDAYLRKLAVNAIEHHPLFYAKLVARRILISTLAVYESTWMYRGGESPIRYHARTGRGLFSYVIDRPLDFLQSALEPALFVLAMLALAFTWRGRVHEHALLIVLALAVFLPYWILHTEPRYVYPAEFTYFIWIALGADLLAERRLRRIEVRSDWRTPTAPARQTTEARCAGTG